AGGPGKPPYGFYLTDASGHVPVPGGRGGPAGGEDDRKAPDRKSHAYRNIRKLTRCTGLGGRVLYEVSEAWGADELNRRKTNPGVGRHRWAGWSGRRRAAGARRPRACDGAPARCTGASTAGRARGGGRRRFT